MHIKSILPLTATIPPGKAVCVRTKLRTAFRPERLLISPQSFPLSLVRRAWTWPLVTIGNVLSRVHRELAKLLCVDLLAAHARREYVSVEYARAHVGEATWDENVDDENENENENEGRPFILIRTPLNRRERLLAPLGRAGRRLSGLRLHWQQAQIATLRVCNITIAKQAQFVGGAAPLPADLFSAFVNFNAPACMVGHEIEIDVHNGNRRECQLLMALIGTTARAYPVIPDE